LELFELVKIARGSRIFKSVFQTKGCCECWEKAGFSACRELSLREKTPIIAADFK